MMTAFEEFALIVLNLMGGVAVGLLLLFLFALVVLSHGERLGG